MYDTILYVSIVKFCKCKYTGGELWSYLYGDREITPETSPYGGLPVHSTALYAAIISVALEHIHDQGYSYRDLKPENLLITANGYLKLVDFGFAKAVPFINSKKETQYRTFTICGTPDYMSP